MYHKDTTSIQEYKPANNLVDDNLYTAEELIDAMIRTSDKVLLREHHKILLSHKSSANTQIHYLMVLLLIMYSANGLWICEW